MLKLYNTLTRKVEPFKTIKPKQAKIYTCGPTVYNYPHIGNWRAFTFYDLFKRYLIYKGFKVKHIMNLTDVDDKTIRDSQKEGVSLKEFTERYTNFFFDDLNKFNILPADSFPKATDFIDDMVKFIQILLKKGIAYKSEDNSIYFDISKFKDYGKLSKTNLKGLKAGARVIQDEYEKDTAADFVLWKAYSKEDGKNFWNTELGKGRPGWHIECSVMAMHYLGNSLDAHLGGVDLIFPHHENEIAQSEAKTGKQFAKFWIHSAHIMVDGKKMAKSAGNFYTSHDLFKKGFNPLAIRYHLISTHYRQKVNFTFKGVEAAQSTLQSYYDFLDKLGECDNKTNHKDVPKIIKTAKKDFEAAMDDDLQISTALAAVSKLTKEINKSMAKLSKSDAKKIKGFFNEIDTVLGVFEKEKEDIPEDIKLLAESREKARKDKDFKAADKIRDQLLKKGYVLEDTPKGPRIKKQ